jgi:hypothetical protein
MKSSGDSLCYFLPVEVSSLIASYDAKIKKGEFESLNKSEKTKDGNQTIKENFIKLYIDRLGNITPFKTNNYNHSTTKITIVSEPEATYQKTNLQTFTSFNEANEADAKAKANTSPEQHLANVTERIKQTYADELKTPMDKTLKFRND